MKPLFQLARSGESGQLRVVIRVEKHFNKFWRRVRMIEGSGGTALLLINRFPPRAPWEILVFRSVRNGQLSFEMSRESC